MIDKCTVYVNQVSSWLIVLRGVRGLPTQWSVDQGLTLSARISLIQTLTLMSSRGKDCPDWGYVNEKSDKASSSP